MSSWLNRRNIIAGITGLFFILILLFGVWMAGLYWLTQIIHQKRPEVQQIIDEQLGTPTSFDTIETHTHFNGIGIALNNVVIMDNKKSIPFVTIQQIELYPNLLQSILNKKLVLKNIQLDGLKIHFIWDKSEDKFKLSGLKGEDIGAFAHQKDVLGSIPLQHSLSLNNAEIEWEGPHTTIIQRLNGQFSWLSSDLKSIQFKGSQALKFNDGNFFKTTPLEFTYDSETREAHLQSGLANAAIDCHYQKDKSFTCDLNADQLDLASLHQNLVLKEEDPAWLKWLVTALPKGYAEGYVKVSGNFEKMDWDGELRFRRLDLQYSPNWPAIENSAGIIKIKKNVVEVDMNKGDINGTPIDNVTATIAPIASKEQPTVSLKGSLSGDLENGMEFLKESPLENIYKKLLPLNPKGGMDLTLDLKIPLHDGPTIVDGSLRVKQGYLMLAELNLPVEQMNGVFDFTEKGLSTKEPVKAVFFKKTLEY